MSQKISSSFSKTWHPSYQMGVRELNSKDVHTGFSMSTICHIFKDMSFSQLCFYYSSLVSKSVTWQDKVIGWLQGSTESLTKASYS